MDRCFVHRRHPACRLATKADAPFPSGASEDDWQHTPQPGASGVDMQGREADNHDGYSPFKIGLPLSEIGDVLRG